MSYISAVLPLFLLLPKDLEKDHYGCTVMVKSVLTSSHSPHHCGTGLWTSLLAGTERAPGIQDVSPVQQQSLFRMLFPCTVLGNSRCRLRDFCFHTRLASADHCGSASFFTRPLLYMTAFLESGTSREPWLFALGWESSPCFPWKMKRRVIL